MLRPLLPAPHPGGLQPLRAWRPSPQKYLSEEFDALSATQNFTGKTPTQTIPILRQANAEYAKLTENLN